jgi:hypothetical protein
MALVVFWRCPERLKEALHAEQRKAALNGRVLTLNRLVTQLVAQVLGVPPQGLLRPRGRPRHTQAPHRPQARRSPPRAYHGSRPPRDRAT